MAKSSRKADNVTAGQDDAPTGPSLGDEKRSETVDVAFVESLVNEAKSYARRACEALSARVGELEERAAAAEDRMTEYDRGGVKYPKDTREYVVQAGETMSQIAKSLLSNAGLFGKIAMWNYDRYPSLRADSNGVEEGWKLRIPPE